MAVECDHGGRKRALAGHVLQLADEMAMTEVHTVIGPDGHGRTPRRGPRSFRVPPRPPSPRG